jgi:hypothetical protein
MVGGGGLENSQQADVVSRMWCQEQWGRSMSLKFNKMSLQPICLLIAFDKKYQ